MSARTKKKRRVMTQLALTARAGRTALAARLAGQGLYSGQDAVLLALGETDGVALRDLADRLQVRPPTITKTLARLTAQGLIEKRPSASDARQSFAHLTERGEALLGEIRLTQAEVEDQATRGLGAKQRRRLAKLLRKVERNLQAWADPPRRDTDAQPAP